MIREFTKDLKWESIWLWNTGNWYSDFISLRDIDESYSSHRVLTVETRRDAYLQLMKTVSLWAKMQQQRREKLTFANDWHSEETLWSEEEFVWSQDSQETDSESENQRTNSKRCRQKYEKWRQFQQWIMFQQKHKIERCSSNKRRKKKSILISCNNCKRKKEELRRVEKQKQNNEVFLTALLFLLFCISFSQLSISTHSDKMTSSLRTSVVDTSATLISSRVSSEIDTITVSFLKYLTLMSSLETSRVSYFEEKNMTDFLERYEDFCDDY